MEAPIPVTGVHHITLVGSNRQATIDFWQGVLGMRLVLEQPNLDVPEETHLFFDPRRRPAHNLLRPGRPGKRPDPGP